MLVETAAQRRSTAVSQFNRRDTTILTQFLANKLSEKGVEVFHVTVAKHLNDIEYQKSRSIATPMLTDNHKPNG